MAVSRVVLRSHPLIETVGADTQQTKRMNEMLRVTHGHWWMIFFSFVFFTYLLWMVNCWCTHCTRICTTTEKCTSAQCRVWDTDCSISSLSFEFYGDIHHSIQLVYYSHSYPNNRHHHHHHRRRCIRLFRR